MLNVGSKGDKGKYLIGGYRKWEQGAKGDDKLLIDELEKKQLSMK